MVRVCLSPPSPREKPLPGGPQKRIFPKKINLQFSFYGTLALTKNHEKIPLMRIVTSILMEGCIQRRTPGPRQLLPFGDRDRPCRLLAVRKDSRVSRDTFFSGVVGRWVLSCRLREETRTKPGQKPHLLQNRAKRLVLRLYSAAFPVVSANPISQESFSAETVSPSPPQSFVGEREGVRWLSLLRPNAQAQPSQNPHDSPKSRLFNFPPRLGNSQFRKAFPVRDDSPGVRPFTPDFTEFTPYSGPLPAQFPN
jgi:hypothetical protein